MTIANRLQSAGLRATPKRIAIGGLLFDGMDRHVTADDVAIMARKKIVEVPASNLKKDITRILYDKGYILSWKTEEDGKQGLIKIALKYDAQTKEPAIRSLERISRPGWSQSSASPLRMPSDTDMLSKPKRSLIVCV